MKLLFFVIAFFTSQLLMAQANNPLVNFDVVHYNFKIEVEENSDSIFCEAIINYKNFKKTNVLSFNLKNQNKFKKGMIVNNVFDNNGNNLKYIHSKDVLNIVLKNNKDSIVRIQYEGVPDNGLIIGKNKFGDKTWFGDNWPNRAQYWLPCVDDIADKATITWNVFAPKEYTVVANGTQLGMSAENRTTNNWKFYQAEPIPTKVAVIGIAKLEKKCTTWKDSIQVCNYYYPQTFAKQPYKMDVANEILSFFEKTIGAYPYTKLNNVQSTTMFGGMENANNIFYDEYSVDDTTTMEPLIAHEIAHQWFGNTVTEKDFSHLWLSEGFATFFTNYYLEKKYGNEYGIKKFNEDKVKVMAFLRENKRTVVDTTKNYMNLLNANSYQKGGLFLNALRYKVTEPVFLNIVQTYFATYKYKNANTDDFRKIVEKITKKDFKPFFKEWLYSTTLPK